MAVEGMADTVVAEGGREKELEERVTLSKKAAEEKAEERMEMEGEGMVKEMQMEEEDLGTEGEGMVTEMETEEEDMGMEKGEERDKDLEGEEMQPNRQMEFAAALVGRGQASW
ncbi:hypothetical protein CYMTET_15617 [Cymbomonas tetramitiformis]|uniref:Uncharacterized protein n=1 Tax=Cymbomonas tetramitiformis TaxID=36881 RepID=A0AAE0GDQ6_9CHLO|nr:hypothetical protein CYMTET_15617 [Cymbomonas tetramitiformis]